jgi:hypothetical protein
LASYYPYTITLNAMAESTPFLTDTLIVMPTDLFVFLAVAAVH